MNWKGRTGSVATPLIPTGLIIGWPTIDYIHSGATVTDVFFEGINWLLPSPFTPPATHPHRLRRRNLFIAFSTASVFFGLTASDWRASSRKALAIWPATSANFAASRASLTVHAFVTPSHSSSLNSPSSATTFPFFCFVSLTPHPLARDSFHSPRCTLLVPLPSVFRPGHVYTPKPE